MPREPSCSPTAPSQRKRAAARHRGTWHVQRAVQFHLTKPWTAARNLSMMCLSHVATRTHRGVFRAVDTLGTSNTKGTARSLRPKSSIHAHWGHGLQWFPSPCATGAAQSKKNRGRCARPPGWRAKYRPHPQGCASSQAAYASGPYRWGPRTSWQWVRVLAESLLTRRWGSPCSACLGRGGCW